MKTKSKTIHLVYTGSKLFNFSCNTNGYTTCTITNIKHVNNAIARTELLFISRSENISNTVAKTLIIKLLWLKNINYKHFLSILFSCTYFNFFSISSAISFAFFVMYSCSSPSIITLTNGSVPDGLINTLPFPANSFSNFSIAFFISSSFS